jgi:hypothetical protein
VVCSTNFLKGSAAASYKTSLHSAKKASTMREHLGSSKISEPTGQSDLRLPVFEVTSLGTGGVTTGKLDRGMPWGIQAVAHSLNDHFKAANCYHFKTGQGKVSELTCFTLSLAAQATLIE